MKPIIVTCVFDSKLQKVWTALSNAEELRKWYFPVENYEFAVGKEFTFYESCDSKNYFHQCKFLSIIPESQIEYSWAHPKHSKGSSVVKWNIKEEGEKTRVTLTHEGVENFADAGESFSRANFEAGWNAILKNMLRNHLYGIQKLTFEIEINALPPVVWQNLWNKKTYSIWTSPFCEGSYYEGEMLLGNRVHLLSPSGEGMYSDIAFYKENELMILKHIGMLKDKKELPVDAETEKWTGCYEVYRLNEINGKTRVKLEVDSIDNYVEYMKSTFPLALNKLKEISETVVKHEVVNGQQIIPS